MDIEVLLNIFKKDISELSIKKDINGRYAILKELKNATNSFDSLENEFLQKFYLSFIDTKEIKILDYSENFKHAEYFFIDKFFDNNLKIFYDKFALKENLLQYKNKFSNLQNVSVNDVLNGYDKDIVSLYVFIENLAKHFGDFAQNNKELKNIFKKKTISFFNALYLLFKNYSRNLLNKYFNIILCNHPMVLVELVKNSFGTNNENTIIETFTFEHKINQDKKDIDNFEAINKELLIEFISILSTLNSNINLLHYNKNNVNTLKYIYQKNIESFKDFQDYSHKFLEDFSSRLQNFKEHYEILIYSEIFLQYISKYNNQNISKNTLFIATGNDLKNKKLKEIVKINNIPKARFEHISMHESYEYRNMIDGFYDGNFINGTLKNICKKAIQDSQNNYYLLISNINHCNINAVFGESLELFSNRYSKDNQNAFISTQNSNIINTLDKKDKYSVLVIDDNSVFAIPENLYIIATFDLIAKNKKLPIAIAEAFKCIYLSCNYNLIKSEISDIKNSDNFIKTIQKLNDFIKNSTNNSKIELDHYTFLKIKKYVINKEINNKSLNNLFENDIEPIIKIIFREYMSEEKIQSSIDSAKAIFDFSR
ncbi:putative type IV methyl-directed restriction system, component McrB [Campylobacter blaseri]|uniref:Uncharacterized protein n=1 Tax=Campylobacter blaseri TaxID=2042961 RepID=A0A2P8R3F7_9BACT|nr:hypothetical protein [Campylobacter blaseri]PSM53024.1 hypothetical protein CQ405_00265 [Campylobacter blaseri]PSM54491.1 hypothetical protein CRN67_00265 [Campylobacter blaseri]QKF85262.1 putative type IV methyl-directed restriction system, component McrB [Campylobacter blaseri]